MRRSINYKRKEGPNWPGTEETFKSGLTTPDNLSVAYSDTTDIGIIWTEGSGDVSISYGTMQITATVVTLSEFYALGLTDKVKVVWTTESEINNAGFNLFCL